MKTHWTHAEIRAARQTALPPILEDLGYRLRPRPDGNHEVIGLAGQVLVKDHYWVRLDDGLAGNAIDFMVKVRGLSFGEAMRLLAS